MRTTLLTLAASLLAVPAMAGDIQMEKMHICCGQCVKIIGQVLGKIEGVSAVKIDKDNAKVSFTTGDAKTGRQAVRKLVNAGFAGKATQDGKEVKLPAPKVEKGTKANSVELTGIHLCCPGCYKAAEGAVKEVEGVSGVSSNKQAKSVTVTGNDVDVLTLIAALRKAGFNGKVKSE